MNKEKTLAAAVEAVKRTQIVLSNLGNQDILDTNSERYKLNLCVETLMFLSKRPYDLPIERKIWREINLIDGILGANS